MYLFVLSDSYDPCVWVVPNILQRIFCSKESILFMACFGKVCVSLPYTRLLQTRVLYKVGYSNSPIDVAIFH